MLIGHYSQARAVFAYDAFSTSEAAAQGLLAGCARAVVALVAISSRALKMAARFAPRATPRG